MKKVVKFEIQDLLPIGLTFVVAGIGLVYGLNVVGDIKSDYCGDSSLEHANGSVCYTCPNSSTNHLLTGESAGNICTNMTISATQTTYENSSNGTAGVDGGFDFNASGDAIKGIAKFPEKMPLIATVVVAAIIIGILVRYLMVRFA